MKTRFHRMFQVRWNHGPCNFLLLFSYSTYTKEEAEDDDDKRRNQKQVTLPEDKERPDSCEHQNKNNQKVLHLGLLWSGNAVGRV